MAFLRKQGKYADAPRPDLVADEQLKTIPVLVLTLSDAPADVRNSYQSQANCYLKKPLSLEEFQDLILSVNRFWLTNVKLWRHPRAVPHSQNPPRRASAVGGLPD